MLIHSFIFFNLVILTINIKFIPLMIQVPLIIPIVLKIYIPLNSFNFFLNFKHFLL